MVIGLRELRLHVDRKTLLREHLAPVVDDDAYSRFKRSDMRAREIGRQKLAHPQVDLTLVGEIHGLSGHV
jgi:hypothetical protein